MYNYSQGGLISILYEKFWIIICTIIINKSNNFIVRSILTSLRSYLVLILLVADFTILFMVNSDVPKLKQRILLNLFTNLILFIFNEILIKKSIIESSSHIIDFLSLFFLSLISSIYCIMTGIIGLNLNRSRYELGGLLFSESRPFISEEVERERLANRITGNGVKNTADILFSNSWIVRDRPVQVTTQQPRFSGTAERVVKQILLGADIRFQVPLPSEIPLDLSTESNRRTIDDHLQIWRYSIEIVKILSSIIIINLYN